MNMQGIISWKTDSKDEKTDEAFLKYLYGVEIT